MVGTVKDLPSLIEYVAAEESARQKSPPQNIAALSKRNSSNGHSDRKCSGCGSSQHGPYNRNRSKQCKAYGKTCAKCGKNNHFTTICKSTTTTTKAIESSTETEQDEPSVNGFVTGMLATTMTSPSSAAPGVNSMRRTAKSNVNCIPIPHHIYDKEMREWKKRSPRSSPTIEISLSVDRQAYKDLQLNMPDFVKRPGAGHSRARIGTLDSGAQLTVMNETELQALGVKRESIFPLALSVNTVTKSSIDLVGGIFLIISAFDEKSKMKRISRQLCYISKSVAGIYLSEEACIDLGYIQQDQSAASVSAMNVKCTNTGVGSDTSCQCPRRTLPPAGPIPLPCKPVVENLPKLKEYILEKFASSAFNVCERQPLPLMDTAPPLRLFVDQQATPKAIMSPAVIPIHWQTPVKEGLDRDEALGVIAKVPVNTPVKWCSRMLVTPKTDGTPRRVIDYTTINRHAPRQLHHTRSPYTIAASVPPNQVKTVLDNWHGYHSVPIHPDDQHLTTFITPYGRYMYKTVPQGFISAGDGYTQRMDQIVQGTPNFDHCVDDSILWDVDIETNFHKVCDFLKKCSNAGCVFNPSKFQFAEQQVNFLGFKITSTGLGPTDEFVDVIKSFPVPTTLTEMRSWLGTINQVSYTFATSKQMEPFRSLLSSKLPFTWSPELNEAFIESKHEVVRQCQLGVRKFEPQRPTALASDWSRALVGCWLTQKFCQCDSTIPGCCSLGWQTVHVSSKFNTPAVANYHPVEGEAYAAAWALEKCKLFTLGNPRLVLAVDHKPLIAILGQDQEMSEVMNPRLTNFKLKSMAFNFRPVYVPGKDHVVPDTMSRRNDSPIHLLEKPGKTPPITNNVLPEYAATFGPPNWVADPQVDEIEAIEQKFIANATAQIQAVTSSDPAAGFKVITWNGLKEAATKCDEYRALHAAVLNRSVSIPETLHPYAKLIQEFTVLEEIVMLQNRVVVPSALRSNVLKYLHAGHQGVQAMLARASQTNLIVLNC